MLKYVGECDPTPENIFAYYQLTQHCINIKLNVSVCNLNTSFNSMINFRGISRDHIFKGKANFGDLLIQDSLDEFK
jgi:hypothetical protein